MLGQLKRRYSARAAIAALGSSRLANTAPNIQEHSEFKSASERSETSVPDHRASVQCSACNTRFSVPEEFAEIEEELRFHCPRCNHIFCSTVMRLGQPHKNHSTESTTQSDNASNFESRVLDFSTGEEQSLRAVPSEHENYISVSDVASVVKEQSAASETKSFFSQQQNLDFSAPVYSSAHTSSGSKLKLDSAPTPNQIQMPFMFELQTKKTREPKESQLKNFLANMSLRQRVSVVVDEVEATAPRTSIEQISQKLSLVAEPGLTFKPVVMQRCLPFVAPAGLLMAALLALTLLALNSSDFRQTLQSIIYPSAVKVAPVGLFLDQLDSQKVILEDGEEMTLISGRILNQTARTMRDLKLEVLAFNSGGQLINTLQTGLGKTLTDSKVKSLSSDVIKRIQGRVDKTVIRPGEEKPFELGLFTKDHVDLNFFNTRIYSVNYN